AKAISKMPLGRIDEETTASIGRFDGGQQTNIVCDYGEILAETRSLVAENMEKQANNIKEAVESTANALGGEADVQIELMYPGFNQIADDQVVEIAKRAVRAIGRDSQRVKSGGGSDANVIAGFGIPTVNLAVGYEDIHTTNERLPVEELIKIAEVITSIIKEVTTK